MASGTLPSPRAHNAKFLEPGSTIEARAILVSDWDDWEVLDMGGGDGAAPVSH